MKNENALNQGFKLGSNHLKIIAMFVITVATFKTMLGSKVYILDTHIDNKILK